MSQDSLLLLLFKVALCADVAASLAFTIDYTRLTRGANWRDPVGRTVVIEALLLVMAIAPSVLSLFFEFNRLTSRIAEWYDVATFASIAVVMLWRVVLFERIHRNRAR